MDIIWANSGRQWRTGKPYVLQSMGAAKSRTWLSDWTTRATMEFLCFNFWFYFLIYYFGCEAGGVSVSSLKRGLNPGHSCESLKAWISNQLATRELRRPLLKCKCPEAGLRRTHWPFLGERVWKEPAWERSQRSWGAAWPESGAVGWPVLCKTAARPRVQVAQAGLERGTHFLKIT